MCRQRHRQVCAYVGETELEMAERERQWKEREKCIHTYILWFCSSAEP